MSQTEHLRGTITKVEQPMDKTLIEVAEGILKDRGIEIASYHDDAMECLCDELYKEYYYHSSKQNLYTITVKEFNTDGDIIHAERNTDGTIDYELRFYNGGASMQECLSEALDKLSD